MAITIKLELGVANRKILSVMSPVWPAVRCEQQGRAIVANQASTQGNSERVCEVVATLSCRKVDVCSVQETKYKDKGMAGVGVFVAEEWIEEVFEVQRVSNRIILVKLIVGQHVVTFLSVYAPQSGLSDEVKDLFFDQLRAVTARIPGSEFLIPCGDWNGKALDTGKCMVGWGRQEPDVERTLSMP